MRKATRQLRRKSDWLDRGALITFLEAQYYIEISMIYEFAVLFRMAHHAAFAKLGVLCPFSNNRRTVD
jgi:hypothetical protein